MSYIAFTAKKSKGKQPVPGLARNGERLQTRASACA